MSEKLRPEHLTRLAVVYVRQSSPGQVRNHRESASRQRGLQVRARQLGWPDERIVILQESGGKTATTTHARDAFRKLSRLVIAGEVGLILAIDVARWSRGNVAWQQLLRDCLFSGVLLADDLRLYDPADSHDSVYLGIQGVLAEHELRQLRERTLHCWWSKARRGELFTAVPTGYVEVGGKGLEKHPNQRIQNSLNRLFQNFRRMPSVLQLCQWYHQRGELLPYVRHGADPHHDVQWLPADYKRLLRLLKNPAYTGAYVLGRTKTILERQPDGELVRRRRPLPTDQWEIVERNRFPSYIDWQEYQQNLAKIHNNAAMQGDSSQPTPRRGASLLSGLLRCARCGHRLHVHYDRSGRTRYVCRGGKRQREQGLACLSFSGRHVEPLFSQTVLDAVRPAAVEAAYQAAQRCHDDRARDRQMRLDHLKQLRYEAERAQRQYDRVEPENRLVAAELEARWNNALAQLDMAQRQFDLLEQQVQTVDEGQLPQLLALAQRLERVWDASHTDVTLRQQIVRTLVEEVIVDVNDTRQEVALWIHWAGGHHTRMCAPRGGRAGLSTTSEARGLIRLLRVVCDDSAMAQALNRNGVRCPHADGAWSATRVRRFRERHGIAAFDPQEKAREGWLSQQEASHELGISPMSVHRLIARGILPAQQAGRGFPSIVRRADLQLSEVQQAVYHIQSSLPRPLPADPSQLHLF